jgi:hypothetical protein
MTMRKLVFSALIVAALAGCATTHSPYGNFVEGTPAAYNKRMVDDAVKQLMAVYPPASTRLDLKQATPDSFGTELVTALRAKGYALLEFKPEGAPAEAAPAPVAVAVPASSALALRYVIDQAGESNLYRVTLQVGHQSLTRAYASQNSVLYPAGMWVRKE